MSRYFEVVRDDMRKTTGEVQLPKRATKDSIGYDIFANNNYYVRPNEVVKIWTDVKVHMNGLKDGVLEGFIINVRSSDGGRFMLANTQGWIEADYYGNEKNDGNIGVFLRNISEEPISIKRGDRIAQGAFVNLLITDNDDADGERKGGFGSTGK